MRRISLLACLMGFFSCECNNEPLQEVLGTPCYTDSHGKIVNLDKNSTEYKEANIGACSTGLTSRDKDQNLICVGEIQPSEEICNGIDDNCNEYIDDDYSGNLLYYPYYSSKNTCVAPGVCKYTEQECIGGQWTCNYPPSYGKEICDGSDNDCDGEIDEDTQDDPIFDSSDRFIYTADSDTINIGECRAGYKECVDGVISIRNMRTPVPEICGNDDDDDCDGLTDEREGSEISNDIVFVIDYSASMISVINSVAEALCDWSSQGILTSSRFAVVGIGYVDGTTNNMETKILTDFTDSATACRIVRENNILARRGGFEFQLDAIYNISDTNSQNMYLSWSGNNKKILVFTDEPMQYRFASDLYSALDMIKEQCVEEEYIIGAFIAYYDINQSEWVDLTQYCGGFLDYLSSDPRQMIDVLNYWIGEDC